MYRVGSRNERTGTTGLSHWVEHMMFKGSEQRSSADVNREFDEMGAQYNAFTSEENTVYYGAVLPEYQHKVLDLLTDMMRPTLRNEDFDMEKNVILEEIALYKDRPQFTVMDEVRETFFGGHPLGNSVLGTTESIQALSRDQMHAYWSRRYAPNNLICVVAGNYDWDAAVRQIEHQTNRWEPAEAHRELTPAVPHSAVKPVPNEKLNRAHVAMAAPGLAAQDPKRYAADVFAEAVGGAEGSRLYWALIEPGLADTAQLYHSEEDGAGAYYLYLSCDPERTQEVLDITRRVLAEASRALDIVARPNK